MSEKDVPEIFTVQFRKTISPMGDDGIADVKLVPSSSVTDPISFCRELLEQNVDGVKGNAWPEIGSVHLFDAGGNEIARYNYFDLIAARGREYRKPKGSTDANPT